jgi:multiple sugar transport system substrate-binding protein
VQVQIVAPDQAESADCFAGWFGLEFDSVRVGRLNLQSLADGDAGFPLDDFYPRFLDAARYQGDLWGVPTSAQVRVMFYNRALFDAAGEPYPEPGWTLAEFLARAAALTAGEGEEKVYGFLPLNGHAGDLRVFVALQGASPWGEEGRPRFDAPDVVAAVGWYADLALAHGVMPLLAADATGLEGWEARRALVREERAAMWTDYAGVDRGDVWPPGGEVGMAPLPLRAAGAEGVTSFSYEGLFIAGDATDPQACWEWLRHLSEQDELVRGLPARASLLESADFAERVGEEAVATYRATLDYVDAWDLVPATSDADAHLEWLNEALERVLAGASPGAAMAEAQRQVEE